MLQMIINTRQFRAWKKDSSNSIEKSIKSTLRFAQVHDAGQKGNQQPPNGYMNLLVENDQQSSLRSLELRKNNKNLAS